MPTATDAVMAGNIPVQVSISSATTPDPEFHYNYNNGQYVGSASLIISYIPSAIHIYADDVALTYYQSSLVAFITCRADFGGGVTKIYLYRAVWSILGHIFVVSANPLYIDTRAETDPVDYFDRVSLAWANSTLPDNPSMELGIAYNRDGNIILKTGQIGSGNIIFSSNTAVTLLEKNTATYPGVFSNPDIAAGDYGHFAVSALYKTL